MGPLPTRVQAHRLLALSTVLDDLASPSSGAPLFPAVTLPTSIALDELLQALSTCAAVSDSAFVCSLVYLGRIDAGICPGLVLTHENLHALLLAAVAVAAAYVDRREPVELVRCIATVAKIAPEDVALLRDALVQTLRYQTYISVATFREYHDILDDIVGDVR